MLGSIAEAKQRGQATTSAIQEEITNRALDPTGQRGALRCDRTDECSGVFSELDLLIGRVLVQDLTSNAKKLLPYRS